MSQIIILEKSIAINATPAKIYNALINAQELMRWRADRAESDASIGGTVVIVRGENEARGVYKRLMLNREVAIQWDRHDQLLPEDLTVFRLEKTAKGTKVIVNNFALPVEVDRIGAEWAKQLKQLKKVYQAASPKPKAKSKAAKKTTAKRKSIAKIKSKSNSSKAKWKK